MPIKEQRYLMHSCTLYIVTLIHMVNHRRRTSMWDIEWDWTLAMVCGFGKPMSGKIIKIMRTNIKVQVDDGSYPHNIWTVHPSYITVVE